MKNTNNQAPAESTAKSYQPTIFDICPECDPNGYYLNEQDEQTLFEPTPMSRLVIEEESDQVQDLIATQNEADDYNGPEAQEKR